MERGIEVGLAILIVLLMAFRCLGIGDPVVGVEHSDDNPESRASSPFQVVAVAGLFSLSMVVIPLATRYLPGKTVRLFAPLDASDVAIGLD